MTVSENEVGSGLTLEKLRLAMAAFDRPPEPSEPIPVYPHEAETLIAGGIARERLHIIGLVPVHAPETQGDSHDQ